MSVDARRGMAHNKPYGLLDHIRLVARDDKSNTGNKEGKETAEYQRWKQGKWHQFWALPRLQGAAMPCVYLFVFACYYPEMESYTLTLTAGLVAPSCR